MRDSSPSTVTAEAVEGERVEGSAPPGGSWGPGWCQPRIATPADDAGPVSILGLVEDQMLPHLDGLDRLWGWQRQAVHVGFAQRPESTLAELVWRYRTLIIELTRQSGKTTIATVIAAIWMSMGGTVLYTAHARSIGRPRWLESARMLERSGFGRLYRGSGSEHVIGAHGGSYWLVTPDDAGGRSHTAHCVIADEAAHIGPEFFASILATMATIPNAMLVLLSSAGWLDAELGSTMRELTDLAVAQLALPADERDTALLSYSADTTDDPADPATWIKCIPTLGQPGGLTMEAVRNAQATMAPADFAREFLTIWTPGTDETAISKALWGNALKLGAKIATPERWQTLGIDVAPDQSYAAIVAAWGGAPKYQLRLIEARRGTEWLVDAVRAYKKLWGINSIVLDKLSPAEALVRTARSELGIRVTEIGATGVVAACARLVSLLQHEHLAVDRSDILTASALDAQRRTVADAGWAFKRRASGPPVAPAMAAAFAAWGESERPRGARIAVVGAEGR